jgi:hypothetical protein
MYDPYQIEIPASFYALYIVGGRIKPNATRDAIAARYELCEDLANHLCEYARRTHFDLGVCEDDVLTRCHRGLLSDAAGVTREEAAWVVLRLAELLAWECPDLAAER